MVITLIHVCSNNNNNEMMNIWISYIRTTEWRNKCKKDHRSWGRNLRNIEKKGWRNLGLPESLNFFTTRWSSLHFKIVMKTMITINQTHTKSWDENFFVTSVCILEYFCSFWNPTGDCQRKHWNQAVDRIQGTFLVTWYLTVEF